MPLPTCSFENQFYIGIPVKLLYNNKVYHLVKSKTWSLSVPDFQQCILDSIYLYKLFLRKSLCQQDTFKKIHNKTNSLAGNWYQKIYEKVCTDIC